MAAAFGVHFGTTSACLAFCRDGKADVVANDAGDRVTPAVVAFTDHDQSTGFAAKQGLLRNASNTICNVKTLLGRSGEDDGVQDIIGKSPVKIIQKDGCLAYEVEYKERRKVVSPVDIAALIYKKMMETAESHGGIADTHDAVVTVPLSFNQEQRQAVRKAACNAGFRVLRIIHEATAAALAYDVGQKDITELCNVLVFRLGGLSLDLTVIRVNGGFFEILGSLTDTSLGGHTITELVMEHFAAEFQRKWKCDCRENKRSMAKLRNGSENCKHVLSAMTAAQCSIESLCEGIDFQGTISRSRFDAICSNFIQKCLQPVKEVLEKSNLSKEDISKVLVCGGSGKIPSLQQQLQEYFPSGDILSTIPPDEVIAIGAAKQAALLSGNEDEEKQMYEARKETPCLSVNIAIQTGTDNTEYVVVLSEHTAVPVRRQKQYSLEPEQTSFCLRVAQAACDQPYSLLAQISMQDLPAGSTINAVFHIREDGSLHIVCTEKTSGSTKEVSIEAS